MGRRCKNRARTLKLNNAGDSKRRQGHWALGQSEVTVRGELLATEELEKKRILGQLHIRNWEDRGGR